MVQEEVCCPRFNTAPWDGKMHVWQEKLFVKNTIPQFLHMPLPGFYGRTIQRMRAAIENANASVDTEDFLMLTQDLSPWKSNLYINVTKELPEAENIKLSGTFLSKVFDGSYSNIPKYFKEMEDYVSARGETTLGYYVYYTTCPKCAKEYGHNYIVIFAQVK